MEVNGLDHLVLTVKDITVTADFYTNVLGMKLLTFGAGRQALHFGHQKINLHQAGHEFEPKAAHPMPGSADLCFVISTDINTAVAHMQAQGIAILEGPVSRSGALGPMTSIYIRDPDNNLIEVASYV